MDLIEYDSFHIWYVTHKHMKTNLLTFLSAFKFFFFHIWNIDFLIQLNQICSSSGTTTEVGLNLLFIFYLSLVDMLHI